MQCHACGYIHADGHAFCPNCGLPAAPVTPVEPMEPAIPFAPVESVNPLADAICRTCRSPLFLIALILFTVSAGVVPSLILVPLWLLFGYCRQEDATRRLNTAPFTFLGKLFAIEDVVLWILFSLCGALLIFFIVVYVVSSINGNNAVTKEGVGAALAAAFCFAYMVCLIFPLILHTNLKNTCLSLRGSLISGTRPEKVSNISGVLLIVIGACMFPIELLSIFDLLPDALSPVVELQKYGTPDFVSIGYKWVVHLTQWLHPIAQILFGAVLLRLNREIRNTRFPMDPISEARWAAAYGYYDPRLHTTATPEMPFSKDMP